MKNMIWVLASIVMGAAGQILLKVGANKIGSIQIGMQGFLSIFKSYYIWLGLALFGTSFLLWVKILTNHDLSYVYPMVSISYIIIILASRFLFHEPFTLNKLLGIIVIIFGVFLINKK